MSIFGWSYPPGCSGPPDDDEGPCEVCGSAVEDCICPECPVCGAHGDPKCYAEHGLVRTLAQDHGAALLEESHRQDCAADALYADWFSEQEQI